MSEPVIKAKAMRCSACNGTPGEWHFEHANDVVLQPLYTRDDLVRAVEASREMAWVQVYNELKSPTIVFEETPSEVVDRLTKGDV